MSYRPLAGGTTSIGVTPAFSGGNCDFAANTDQSLMVKTQYPHVFFKPQKSEGCEMELPFIYPSPWLNLKDSNLDSLKVMGNIYLEQFQPLYNSSGTAIASPINISIYVWASDVKLSGASLCLQAATNDEYSDRPVSTISSSVAAAAGALSTIPIIGPYMRATSMVATAISKVAHWFGFTNPPVIEPVRAIINKPCINIASPEIPTQIEKISMDPKNELSIDPALVGCQSEDQMHFKSIQDRNVYFNKCTWLPSDTYDTALFSALVSPVNYFNTLGTSASTITRYITTQMTPGAMIAQNFEYWRGDIKYTFKIAASAFHRGRVRILYDPNGPSAVSPYSVPRVHQAIWDISESDTFEFVVPFMAPTAWLECDTLPCTGSSTQTTSTARSAAPVMAYSSKFNNGYIQLSVLNELTSAAGGTVTISAFINTANVEFASPKCMTVPTMNGEMLLYVPQSASTTIPSTHDDMTYNTMGESVCSVRSIIHRAQFWDEVCPQLIPAATRETIGYEVFYNTVGIRKALLKWLFPRLPLPRHYGSLGLGPSTVPLDGSFPWSAFSNNLNHPVYIGSNSKSLPLTLFSSCYVGWRGSVVWRAFATNYGNDSVHAKIMSTVLQPDHQNWADLKPSATDYSDLRSNSNICMSHGLMVAWDKHNQPTSGAELFKAFQMNSSVMGNAYTGFYGAVRNETVYNPGTEAIFPHYSPIFMYPSNMLAYQNYLAGPSASIEHDTLENYGLAVNSSDTVSLQQTVIPGAEGALTGTPGNFLDASIGATSLYAAAGPDFSMFQFLAVPTMYRALSVIIKITPYIAPELP